MPKNNLKSSKLQPRPPVVAVMGHIDHGKTSLLDKIRRSNIAAKEVGGITQHIGAWQVEVEDKKSGKKKITFIDTPGHAAFSQMRARGASVTDIVVLVVAADDGVQVQTKESLEHIKSAKVPFLVAINKIDLPSASIDKVKAELVEIGIIPEDYGGKVVTVPVSAKTGQGIDELLEMILLMAEMEDLKADPAAAPEGVIIESLMDSKIGPTATVLVKNGMLKTGDQIFTNGVRAKVKAMINSLNQRVNEAFPSDSVRIIGFKEVPPVGAKVETKITETAEKKVESSVASGEEEKQLKAIFKADTEGVLEAIINSLPSEVNVVLKATGEITESDVFLAKTTGAKIFALNVRISPFAQKLAEQEKVVIKTYKIIYDLLEEIQKTILRILEPMINEKVYGKAEVIADFEIDKKRVIGCRITEGKVIKKEKIHLSRNNEIIGDARIVSMKHLKEDIEEAEKGVECGLLLKPQLDFKIGDVVISYSELTIEE